MLQTTRAVKRQRTGHICLSCRRHTKQVQIGNNANKSFLDNLQHQEIVVGPQTLLPQAPRELENGASTEQAARDLLQLPDDTLDLFVQNQALSSAFSPETGIAFHRLYPDDIVREIGYELPEEGMQNFVSDSAKASRRRKDSRFKARSIISEIRDEQIEEMKERWDAGGDIGGEVVVRKTETNPSGLGRLLHDERLKMTARDAQKEEQRLVEKLNQYKSLNMAHAAVTSEKEILEIKNAYEDIVARRGRTGYRPPLREGLGDGQPVRHDTNLLQDAKRLGRARPIGKHTDTGMAKLESNLEQSRTAFFLRPVYGDSRLNDVVGSREEFLEPRIRDDDERRVLEHWKLQKNVEDDIVRIEKHVLKPEVRTFVKRDRKYLPLTKYLSGWHDHLHTEMLQAKSRENANWEGLVGEDGVLGDDIVSIRKHVSNKGIGPVQSELTSFTTYRSAGWDDRRHVEMLQANRRENAELEGLVEDVAGVSGDEVRVAEKALGQVQEERILFEPMLVAEKNANSSDDARLKQLSEPVSDNPAAVDGRASRTTSASVERRSEDDGWNQPTTDVPFSAVPKDVQSEQDDFDAVMDGLLARVTEPTTAEADAASTVKSAEPANAHPQAQKWNPRNWFSSAATTSSVPATSSSLLTRTPGHSPVPAWHQKPPARPQARAYHTSPSTRQQRTTPVEVETLGLPTEFFNLQAAKKENPNGIRAQLRRWQAEHGDDERLFSDPDVGRDVDSTSDISNNLTRLPENTDAVTALTASEQEEDEREAMAHFTQSGASEEPNSADTNTRFLNMGDLVEIEYLKSDAPNLVAVFVRRVGKQGLAQLYTLQGRWAHFPEKKVQYAIPGWVTEDQVRPLLKYLPSEEVVETKMEELMEQSYMKDLSVPREVAAPLVSRMVQFDAEAKEVYRRHAGTLDNAHSLLAHETDLRYGSLVSAATTLLRLPADKLPVTALFAVRQALSHAGFAFNIDRRSHRLTGYLQIRSKEQVRMVESVRGWLRDWQDDLAKQSTMTDGERRRWRVSKGAGYVYGFLEKAKKIVARSRKDREPTVWGNIGPSKVRIPIKDGQECVKIETGEVFSEQDTELVRFIEAWSLSQMFVGLPRIQALPPLLLQAMGTYEEHELLAPVGLLFLQEIGTILPYENRVRFDQHLLLPSSQHSKPLQNLMQSLMDMAGNHDFKDSMADLRHDWGQLPVYCIDAASAHEIDDGVSIEPAAVGTDGVKEWWVHIHIANPTAFFARDHPLAKMARHMGESIYMPERTYMMLPRWSTQRHFSLDRNRPCLTFSARMDEQGNTLEHKVRSGTIRKVLRLTHEEVAEVLGVAGDLNEELSPELVLTVGGELPPQRKRRSHVPDVTPKMAEQLKKLVQLGERRQDVRKAGGGLFFDSAKPEISVWQSWKNPGLAWDHPYRKGWRRVEGDPVIQMKTRGLTNWFAPSADPVAPLVREMMLLACEIAAKWCEERAIPAVFRGSVKRPDKLSSDKFYEQILAPAQAKNPKGQFPMHLGMQYLETFGNTALSIKPFPHAILGMAHYGKVTSPLRRYGDMILHWQIEAALREEASTGQSLVTNKKMEDVDRKFLPFSANVLNTILVGLQPRESIIMRAKGYAENFWITQLLFRAHHFGETPLPFGNTVRAYVHTSGGASMSSIGCIIQELNISASMSPPDGIHGRWGSQAQVGDVWECEIEGIDCYRRIMEVKAVRLVERVDA
ncbi:3'-5' RNA exonuclease complex component [Elasticomyces elasticus]|nr:3'-5' RNA exonuclease complex component [Elasticomyces elasticus]KAK4974286.1 3'-5' RNA exonuclease complex component [Elasticomyces elasticus]